MCFLGDAARFPKFLIFARKNKYFQGSPLIRASPSSLGIAAWPEGGSLFHKINVLHRFLVFSYGFQRLEKRSAFRRDRLGGAGGATCKLSFS